MSGARTRYTRLTIAHWILPCNSGNLSFLKPRGARRRLERSLIHSREGPLMVPTLLFLAMVGHADETAVPPSVVVRPDAFKTLVNPACSHCVDEAKRRAKELKPDDRVLAWTRGYSEGGAIPVRFFLNTYRVISDSY